MDKVYYATFHTHLGALLFEERLKSLGDPHCEMCPVPRKLSVSCGTGVRFSMDFDESRMLIEDLDAIFLKITADSYEKLWEND